MTYLMGQMFFCLLIAFLLGLLIAWLWRQITSGRGETAALASSLKWRERFAKLESEHNKCSSQIGKAKRNLAALEQENATLKASLETDQRQPNEDHENPNPTGEGNKVAATNLANETNFPNDAAYTVALNRASRLQEDLHRCQQQLAQLQAQDGASYRPPNLYDQSPAQTDDLEVISGVGPMLHRKLNELGIYCYRQIASFSERDVAWVSDNLTVFKHRITRDNWVRQAERLHRKKYAADR